MLLVAFVIWVLAGPIIKPVIIDIYAEYEAAQNPQTLVGHKEDNQLDIPGTAADLGEDVIVPIELPKVELKWEDVTSVVIAPDMIVTSTPIKPQKISKTSKIKVVSANQKNNQTSAEKLIENKELKHKIPPFVSPYNIR